MEWIDEHAFSFQNSLLRNIAIHPDASIDFTGNTECTILQLKNRFHNLPLHKLCFEHARFSLCEFLTLLYQLRATHYKKIDCQGMTALHILLLSDIRDVEKCHLIYYLHPAALITTDNHGETPLDYLIEVSGAEDVLSFFWKNEGVCLVLSHQWNLTNYSRMMGTLSSSLR